MTPQPAHTPADTPHAQAPQRVAQTDDGEETWGFESALPYLQGSFFSADVAADAPTRSGWR